MQAAQAPGSRRVVSTEWTAAGIRAAASAGDKAIARSRRRSGLQRHSSVASALEVRSFSWRQSASGSGH